MILDRNRTARVTSYDEGEADNLANRLDAARIDYLQLRTFSDETACTTEFEIDADGLALAVMYGRLVNGDGG